MLPVQQYQTMNIIRLIASPSGQVPTATSLEHKHF
jgi:hypothetical protein